MTLFDPPYDVVYSEDEWTVFNRPVNGDGGAEGLLRKLKGCAVPGAARTLLVEYALLDRAYVYAYRYESGGFQDRFRATVRAALRAGWTPPLDPDEAVPRHPHSGGAFGQRRE